MKKQIIYAALAALALGACAKTEVLSPVVEEDLAVEFGTYLGNAQTKSGYVGDITITELQDAKDGDKTRGFGVYAYYTGNADYQLTGFTPNFMANEQIYYASSTWKYDVVKYWPNDNTDADDATNGAVGVNNAGKVSFFAYAPYVSGTLTTTGITAVPANSDAEPKVSYTLASTGKNVDLLWGTTGTGNGETVRGSAQNGKSLATGQPNVNADLTKMKNTGKVSFNFKHALAKLGAVKVQAVYDDAPTSANVTKISIKEIMITPTASKASGKFSLATGLWSDLDGSVTVESIKISEDNIKAAYTEKGNSESTTWSSLAPALTGVTTSADIVTTDEKFVSQMFIPGEKNSFEVQITYMVRTEDSKLSLGCSYVPQTIKKTVQFASELVAGNSYTLIIKLGMNSVEFNASVEGWGTGSDVEVNLPLNVS